MAPTATVHHQIAARDRVDYAGRGRILDVVTDIWPAGPALTGLFSANGTAPTLERPSPLAEVKYVLKGELKIAIDGKDYTLVPGDLLSVPLGAVVKWYPSKYEVLLFTQREQMYPPAHL
ncbi:hypothetical protein JCM10207_001700 [Rhodosporidiobolus poonsookiae]